MNNVCVHQIKILYSVLPHHDKLVVFNTTDISISTEPFHFVNVMKK